jgi:hypothetical protein
MWKISSLQVVVILNPVSYDSATSVRVSDYIVVKSFTWGERTECVLNGGKVSPQEALEGARYGWYECRVPVVSGGVGKSSVYKEDTSALGVAIGAAGLFALFALAFGE